MLIYNIFKNIYSCCIFIIIRMLLYKPLKKKELNFVKIQIKKIISKIVISIQNNYE